MSKSKSKNQPQSNKKMPNKKLLDLPADLTSLEVLLPDSCGILRGKKLPAKSAAKALLGEITFPGSIYCMDITGETIASAGLVWDDGDADYPCLPVNGTLVPIPWAKDASYQLLLEMHGNNGQAFFASPRQILRQQLEKFKHLKLRPVAAIELEFYFTSRQWGGNVPPCAPNRPGRASTLGQTHPYDLTVLQDFSEIIDDIMAACKAQNLPADSALAEYSQGQFEINLRHSDDLLSVADQAVLFKRTVKAIAARHNLDATFMPKPYAEHAGSGLHVHLSLYDAKGLNIFSHPTNPERLTGSTQLNYAIGGLLKTMPDALAIFAQSANAYRRFKPLSYAPLTASWSPNNRTTAIRIPPGKAADRRIEHRLSGADANPYLTLAAILAGIHHGITKKIKAPPAVEGNAYRQTSTDAQMPATWQAALAQFSASEWAKEYFGERFRHVFGATKLAECEKFNSHITSLEYDWYLRQA